MKISKQARREASNCSGIAWSTVCWTNTAFGRSSSVSWRAKPRGYLAILSQFQRLVKLDLERRTARIESAAPLGAELQNSLQTSLGRVYGDRLEFRFCPGSCADRRNED